MRDVVAEDDSMLVWWGSRVECASALARVERNSAHEAPTIASAFQQLAKLAAEWHEVDPSELVREAATRFLRVHALRAADALQLAAAMIASDQRTAAFELVTLDERLGLAARKEGFVVVGI
jgi:predicted nucleic acid-binding protein